MNQLSLISKDIEFLLKCRKSEQHECCYYSDCNYKNIGNGKLDSTIGYVINVKGIRFVESLSTINVQLLDVLHYNPQDRDFCFHSSSHRNENLMLYIKFLKNEILFNHNGSVYRFASNTQNFKQMMLFIENVMLSWWKYYVGKYPTIEGSLRQYRCIFTVFAARNNIIKLLLLGFLDGDCLLSRLPKEIFKNLIGYFDIWFLPGFVE